jgi:1-acyl-sn-glycerol-3-phosphate acyltransferase
MPDVPTQDRLPAARTPFGRSPLARPLDEDPRIARGTITAFELGNERTEPASDGMLELEPFFTRWGRRAITIPGVFVATALYLAVLPLVLVVAAAIDLVRRRPFLLVRFHLAVVGVVAWHCVGLLALGLWWIVGKSLRLSLDRWRHFHRALESWWADKALGIATLVYRTRFVVEDAHVVKPGPVVVLCRHASTLDTVLPLRVLGRGPVAMILRIVKKRELLWDPCVDLMSHRLPRALVRRGSIAVGRELRRLVRLCDGMDADDAVVIYPEGTRFTPAKRAEIIARLSSKRPEEAARAARLRHVLPIRPAGTLALLDAQPEIDVVFCAHTGLEGASRLDDLVAGSLLDCVVRVKFWRVPRAEVPVVDSERIAWLGEWWERVDAWIAANQG